MNSKILLILGLSAMAHIGATSEQYPNLSERMCPKAAILQACEENDAAWRFSYDKTIAEKCQRIDKTIPFLLQWMDKQPFTTKGESLVFEKRQFLLEYLSDFDTYRQLENDIDIILKNKLLTSFERKQVSKDVHEYILSAARSLDRK